MPRDVVGDVVTVSATTQQMGTLEVADADADAAAPAAAVVAMGAGTAVCLEGGVDGRQSSGAETPG